MALNGLKEWAHLRLTYPLWARLPRGWGRLLFSQEGEDALLARLLEGRRRGFYVDVGAHHPFRFSNTAYFYGRGWRGINIDARPGAMAAFRAARPRDVNLEAGVAARRGTLVYHVFNEPALNTFDPDVARAHEHGEYRLLRRVPLPVAPLGELLRPHLAPGQAVDFMSVDVEGKDLEVLQSHDWGLCRPHLVAAECLDTDYYGLRSAPTARFLARRGYRPVARTMNTVVFRDARRG